MDAAIQKIKDTLIISKNMDFPITDICEVIGLPYVVRSMHTIPEDQDRQMPVYHMVLHLCDLERRRAAKEARAK